MYTLRPRNILSMISFTIGFGEFHRIESLNGLLIDGNRNFSLSHRAE